MIVLVTNVKYYRRDIAKIMNLLGLFIPILIHFQKPSSGDLLNILREGMGCIGSAKNNKIRCYFFDKNRGYNYYKETYDQIEKIGQFEGELSGWGSAKEKPELWLDISRKMDNNEEKAKIIQKYFEMFRII
jgi:hypothetical protein